MILDYTDFLNLKIIPLVDINILKIKNHPKIPYTDSIRVLTDNFRLSKISDIIEFWKNKDVYTKELNDINWMYIYCMKYGFLKNLDKRNINIYGDFRWTTRPYNLTRKQADEYLSKLDKMTDEELGLFLLENPFNIYKNNVLDDGTHRCCAMIGRIIRNDKYIDMTIKRLNYN